MQFMGSQSPAGDNPFNQPADTQESFAPAAQDTPFVQENPVVEVIPTRSARKKATPTPEFQLPAQLGAGSAVLLQPTPAAPVKTLAPQPSNGKAQTWLVMLYQDADDKVLEQDIFFDLNEAERVGSSDRVQIVAQLDRYRRRLPGRRRLVHRQTLLRHPGR